MGLPVNEVQTALISLYRGDATLQGLLGGNAPTWDIYDMTAVPEPNPFPFVVLGIITSQLGRLLAMGHDGVDIFVQTSVFTRYGGFEQARTIAARLYHLTQQTALSLSSGYSNPFTLFDNYQEIEETSSGIGEPIQHIPMRWHLMTSG